MDFKKTRLDSGVSPVVGVILMVAVTVILSAVIGTFVLDLGGSVNENPQAGVTFEQSANGQFDTTDDGTNNGDTQEYAVVVQVVDFSSADYLTVEASDEDNSQYDASPGDSTSGLSAYDPQVAYSSGSNLTATGQTAEATQLTAGDTLTVIGSLAGKETVLQSHTVNE